MGVCPALHLQWREVLRSKPIGPVGVAAAVVTSCRARGPMTEYYVRSRAGTRVRCPNAQTSAAGPSRGGVDVRS